MPASVTVRMYNQLNLGDCFLLHFKEKTHESYVLIDFGSYESGNEEREREIANSIKDTVGNKPLTIVLTHQHKDHLTGFISAADIIGKLNISDLWFSYLDDPKGKEAKAMRKVMVDFWNKNRKIKEKTREKFGAVPEVKRMLAAKDAIDLFGEEQTGGEALTNLLQWCKKNPEFLLPGRCFDLPGLPKDSVRVYVMGPPTDPKLLRKMDPSKDEAVHSLHAMTSLTELHASSTLMLDALHVVTSASEDQFSANFPFNKKFNYPLADKKQELMISHHYQTQDTWRRIDHEWLAEMGRLSLHMGDLTNNSSLVLAFELVAQQKVLLFAADAQIGNWKSWMDVAFEGTDVDAEDLLTRTSFYKAGHHSSHNATLASSLDLMNEDELVIMIPVNEEVSTNRHFAMLKLGMLKGYNRKSQGRVLRSDTVFHTPGSGSFVHPFAQSETDFTPKIRIENDQANESHLFIEYVVK